MVKRATTSICQRDLILYKKMCMAILNLKTNRKPIIVSFITPATTYLSTTQNNILFIDVLEFQRIINIAKSNYPDLIADNEHLAEIFTDFPKRIN